MRRIVLLAVLLVAVVAIPRPARACPDGDWIPDWIGYPIAAGMIGGYAYGTGYFLQQDITTDRRDRDYVVGEMTFNGLAGTLFGMATADAISNHSASAIPLGAMTVLHGSLLVHAAMRVEVGDVRVTNTALTWGLGSVYAIETLGFIAETSDDHHGRGYGVMEASIQTPIAAGLAYLAYNRVQNGSPGTGILFGGMAAVSGALAYHGMKTAISPYVEPKLDFLGTDLMPTIVDDGHDMGPGIAAARRW